jgi:hypothetical protein
MGADMKTVTASDFARLKAIDVHVHAEISCCDPEDPILGEFFDASSKYFKADRQRPTIPRRPSDRCGTERILAHTAHAGFVHCRPRVAADIGAYVGHAARLAPRMDKRVDHRGIAYPGTGRLHHYIA